MQYITTISQKGQVVVPKEIRDKLDIKPSDTLQVTTSGKNIILEPTSSVEDHLGMFSVKKPISKKDIKESFNKHQAVKNK
jgi:AbrB family looped-hinge helix DNA binding protein